MQNKVEATLLVDQLKQGQRKSAIKCFLCGEPVHKSSEYSKSVIFWRLDFGI